MSFYIDYTVFRERMAVGQTKPALFHQAGVAVRVVFDNANSIRFLPG